MTRNTRALRVKRLPANTADFTKSLEQTSRSLLGASKLRLFPNAASVGPPPAGLLEAAIARVMLKAKSRRPLSLSAAMGRRLWQQLFRGRGGRRWRGRRRVVYRCGERGFAGSPRLFSPVVLESNTVFSSRHHGAHQSPNHALEVAWDGAALRQERDNLHVPDSPFLYLFPSHCFRSRVQPVQKKQSRPAEGGGGVLA